MYSISVFVSVCICLCVYICKCVCVLLSIVQAVGMLQCMCGWRLLYAELGIETAK